MLRDALSRLDTDNAQGELYLTDVLTHRRAAPAAGSVPCVVEDAWQVEGVNDRVQLAALHRELNRRTVEAWMRAGTTVVDPRTTWIDADVTLEPDTLLEPNVLLRGSTRVAAGASRRTQLPPRRHPRSAPARPSSNTTSDGAVIGPEATVGPYTYLRPGTRLGRGAKAGGFVEMKNGRAR